MVQLRYIVFFFLSVIIFHQANAQQVKLLSSGTKTSLRGLCPVSKEIIWASGSNGYVGLSKDGGITWFWSQVEGYEKSEFRDIEAFDGNTALIMGITEPAVILRTVDAGKTWRRCFTDTMHAAFFDAMEFWNLKAGILIGDPVDGRIYIARTFDGGKTWKALAPEYRPIVDSGEACFASSGTNIRKLTKQEAVFITGGKSSRLFMRDEKIRLPLLQGKETTGANSIAVKNKNYFVVVGGDFMRKDDTTGVCVYTSDAGKTWQVPEETCHGYRSCIEYVSDKTWLACGLNGIDISQDDAKHFRKISEEGFHVCRKAKDGKKVFFAGSNGRIAVME